MKARIVGRFEEYILVGLKCAKGTENLLLPIPTTVLALCGTAGRYARVVTRCHAMRMAEP
ncbi:MAG: hypothetical protein ACXWP6_09485 [Ktedonobacterales bacterium]